MPISIRVKSHYVSIGFTKLPTVPLRNTTRNWPYLGHFAGLYDDYDYLVSSLISICLNPMCPTESTLFD